MDSWIITLQRKHVLGEPMDPTLLLREISIHTVLGCFSKYPLKSKYLYIKNCCLGFQVLITSSLESFAPLSWLRTKTLLGNRVARQWYGIFSVLVIRAHFSSLLWHAYITYLHSIVYDKKSSTLPRLPPVSFWLWGYETSLISNSAQKVIQSHVLIGDCGPFLLTHSDCVCVCVKNMLFLKVSINALHAFSTLSTKKKLNMHNMSVMFAWGWFLFQSLKIGAFWKIKLSGSPMGKKLLLANS